MKPGGSLKIAEAFNKHFTEYLWPRGEVIPRGGCSGDPADPDADEE